ncbi:MAG: hypothetical protein RI519_00500 [Balneolaceae bacterium]|nr:hypothetical protein [Balneolaceae bacterium]
MSNQVWMGFFGWCLLTIIAPTFLYAQVGGASGIQSRLFMSSYERSLGGVVASMSSSKSALALSLNPAAARSQSEPWEALMQTSVLTFDRAHHRVSVHAPLDERLGLRVHVAQYRVGDIEGRSLSGYPTQTFSTSESMVGVQLGLAITENIEAGVGISWHHSSLHPDLEPATTIGVDLGVQSKLSQRYTWMVVAKDLLATYRWTTGTIAGSTQEGSIRQGFTRRFLFGHSFNATDALQLHHSVTLSTQQQDSPDRARFSESGLLLQESSEQTTRALSTSFGLDWAAHSRLSLQIGLHSTPFSEVETTWKGSGGFMLDLEDVPVVDTFHYAIWREHPDIGFAHTFSLTFTL